MRFRRLLIAFCVLAFASFAALPAARPAAAAAGMNWQVSAGSGTPDSAIATMNFYPPVITIDEGDSITWTSHGEAHTVTFLSGNPFPRVTPDTPVGTSTTYDGTGVRSSGVIPPETSFTLTFTKAGTYPYLCMFHPGMVGKVVVQPAGTPYPMTQADINEQATVAAQVDLGKGITLRQQLQTAPPATTTNSDGSTNYNVMTGANVGQSVLMRFAPGKLTIHVGDTVTWTNPDALDPHTVTFAPDGNYPEFPSPAALTPAGGPTYDGTAFTNSGQILPPGAPNVGVPGAPSVTTYTLKFTKAGVYVYHCLVHDMVGMIGKIRVVAAGASTNPGPPIATVANNPALGPILVDSNGRTLYFLTSEIAGQPLQCTGKCLNFWLPLTVATPTTDAVEGPGVTGTFEVHARPDGINQVYYGESPLYTFVGDKAPGDIKGQGIKAFGGVWLAAQVTPNTLIAPIVTAHANNTGTSASFVVSFSSTVAGQGSVEFAPGTSCSGLVETATQDVGAGTTAHTIQVKGNELPGTVGDNGIQPGMSYSFRVVTTSSSGVQVDDNGGTCYHVTIPSS